MSKLKPNQFLLDGQVITEHPILFSTEMVQANLAHRKTQTRRILKVKGCKPFVPDSSWTLEDIKRWTKKDHPYGKPGDLLYVRETWTEWPKGEYQFKASTARGEELGIWKPSLHLPKSGSRIWAMVEDIRIERLQDISEEDAKAEGIFPHLCPINGKDVLGYKNYWHGMLSCPPIKSFQSLWESINGEEFWKANPWVWVVKYRILSKTGRPNIQIIQKSYQEIAMGKEAGLQMRFFKHEGSDTSDWGWEVNPVNGVIYSMDELEKMYGESDFLFETVLSTWKDEAWEPDHGEWIEVTGKEAHHVG